MFNQKYVLILEKYLIKRYENLIEAKFSYSQVFLLNKNKVFIWFFISLCIIPWIGVPTYVEKKLLNSTNNVYTYIYMYIYICIYTG